MIRVLIVDDHQVVRQGLRFLLEQEGDIEVVGECADGPSAMEAVRTLAPTVVLLDLFLPGLDGIGVLAQIKQDRPATEVLMLTSSSNDEHLLAAVRAGALAYVPKTAGVDQLVDSVRAAARGESVLEPRIAARLVREVREVAVRRRPLDQLTPRELEVLAALAHGRATGRSPGPWRSAKRRSRHTSPASWPSCSSATAPRPRSSVCSSAWSPSTRRSTSRAPAPSWRQVGVTLSRSG